MKGWTLVAAVVLTGIIALSLALTGAVLGARFQDTNKRREIQREVNKALAVENQKQSTALKLFICLFQHEVSKGDQTPAQQERADRFFREALELIDATPCKEATN